MLLEGMTQNQEFMIHHLIQVLVIVYDHSFKMCLFLFFNPALFSSASVCVIGYGNSCT
jgi:hypothetical protein